MTLVRTYRWFLGCAVCGALGYCWWATGLQQFTVTAYVAVGIPLVAVAAFIALHSGPPGRWSASCQVERERVRRPEGSVTVWVAIGATALVLEGVGLALGGRSSAVPTLSDVIDHMLVCHTVRAGVFAGWLMVMIRPVIGDNVTRVSGRVT